MHGLQIVPLGELLSELPHGAALVPAFERDALIEDLLVDEDAEQTAELAAVSAETGARPAPAAPAETWLSAAAAAEALDVSVRHLRRLATAGKLERRRDNERTVYRIAPYLEAQRQQQLERAATPAADTGAAPSPDTCRSAEPADAADAADAEDAVASEVTGIVRRTAPAQRREVSVHDSETVIAVEDIDLFEQDDEDDEPHKIVAQELVNTNRELMRLVEGMLGRWSEVNAEHNLAQGEVKRALQGTLQIQQCLQHWQHHASTLERQILEKLHVATRALDVADEALSTRWTSTRRQQTLRTRLEALRVQLEQ